MKRVLLVLGILLLIGLGAKTISLQKEIAELNKDVAAADTALCYLGMEHKRAQDKLAAYEAPYDELLVLKDTKPRRDKACTKCCCGKNLPACHVACIKYKGGHNAMCQGLCAMKARGIPMPMEH